MILKCFFSRLGGKPSERFFWGLFITWAVVVSLIAAHHEFWRDEVHPLSLVVQSPSLSDL